MVLLVPLIWAALFHRRCEEPVVTLTVSASCVYIWLNPDMATTSELIGGCSSRRRWPP